ncbi:MAG: VanZ family protein, partial [Desulfomonilia bacterium]
MAAAVAVLLLVDFDRGTRVVEEMCNIGHLPLFGVVALVVLWLLGGRQWPVQERRAYTGAFFAAVGLGVVMEIAQVFSPGRYFELEDILLNSLGALSFLMLAFPYTGFERTKALRWRAAGILIIAAALVPVGLTAMDDWRMKREFPLLGSFESRLEMGRWSAKDAAFSRSERHASHGRYSLEARLMPGEYPGVGLQWVENDWRGYDWLCFDAFLEEDTPLALTVRVHDREHDRKDVQDYSDRFNRTFVLDPGAHQVRISLDEVRTAPLGREMDMAQ